MLVVEWGTDLASNGPTRRTRSITRPDRVRGAPGGQAARRARKEKRGSERWPPPRAALGVCQHRGCATHSSCRRGHLRLWEAPWVLSRRFDAVGPDAREQPSVVDVGTARLHVFEEAISADAGAPGWLHHPT